MAFFDLRSTGGTNIQTTFRFELEVATDASNTTLGLSDDMTAYITRCELPTSETEALSWYMPGGMANYQAGQRKTKPINLDFVVCSEAKNSWYRILKRWQNATFNLNDGTNKGKALYASDALSIRVKGEDGITKFRFHLLRAQMGSIDMKEVNSESSELLKVSCTIIYDNFEIYNGNNQLIERV